MSLRRGVKETDPVGLVRRHSPAPPRSRPLAAPTPSRSQPPPSLAAGMAAAPLRECCRWQAPCEKLRMEGMDCMASMNAHGQGARAASDDELKATCSAKFEAYRVCLRQWQQAEKERRVREGDTGFRKMKRQISGVGDQSS